MLLFDFLQEYPKKVLKVMLSKTPHSIKHISTLSLLHYTRELAS